MLQLKEISKKTLVLVTFQGKQTWTRISLCQFGESGRETDGQNRCSRLYMRTDMRYLSLKEIITML